MENVTARRQNHRWKGSMSRSPQEFDARQLTVVSGDIPRKLCGSLYLNGPALFDRAGERIAHWLDGDGAVLRINFFNTGATATYRYIQTEAFQKEAEVGKFVYGSFGRTPAGSIWQKMTTPMKNVANAGLLATGDRLLALWEQGLPHTLDLDTLKTAGLTTNIGLKDDETYSVHPKIDPDTGNIFNFGVNYGPFSSLNIYRSDPTGKIHQKATISLKEHPLIHDFVLAGNYLVFCIPPVRLNLLPYLTKQKSFSESLTWKPEKQTEILVIDRTTFKVVSRRKTDPWFQWRFGNGYVDRDGTIVIDVCRYEDFQVDRFLKEIGQGIDPIPVRVALWQMRIDPHAAEVIDRQQILDRGCEFPTFDPRRLGKVCPSIYFLVRRAGIDLDNDLSGGLACFNYQSGILTEAKIDETSYLNLPIYISHPHLSDRGWIATQVYNAQLDRSEIWIFDAADISVAPVCKLALPGVIPPAFQGVWQSDR
jgi:all-trans-8'-apo-beta-carotenal 15,15'-oxygenase